MTSANRHSSGFGGFVRSRTGIALLVFLAVGAFLLISMLG